MPDSLLCSWSINKESEFLIHVGGPWRTSGHYTHERIGFGIVQIIVETNSCTLNRYQRHDNSISARLDDLWRTIPSFWSKHWVNCDWDRQWINSFKEMHQTWSIWADRGAFLGKEFVFRYPIPSASLLTSTTFWHFRVFRIPLTAFRSSHRSPGNQLI
jgi:hypothetical protein